MSSDALIKTMRATDTRLRQTETREVSPLYLPWSQRVLNPLAATAFWGDMAQPWAVNVVAFTVSVYVAAPNDGANFWTLTLVNGVLTVLATLTTAAITANTWTRLSTTAITQPSAANPTLSIVATKTLAPGAIYIAPALALLRTGN